jgi:hypothetical protein
MMPRRFSCDVTDGHGMMFVHWLAMMVIDIFKVWSWAASQPGGLIKSGVQGNTATFAHFDFAGSIGRFLRTRESMPASARRQALPPRPRSESHSTVPRLQCS